MHKILVPNIGDFKDVSVIEVLVKVGDQIKKEQSLIAIETDKAVMEIPSEEAGEIISLQVKVGDKISEGDLICELKTADQAIKSEIVSETAPSPSIPAPAPTPAPVPTPAPLPSIDPSQIHAGPATRRLARELNIDLHSVEGSGQQGRIVQADLHPLNTEPSLSSVSHDFSQWGEISLQPLSRIKKISARFLHNSWTTIPHVTNFDEADITDLEAFRQSLKAEAQKAQIKLTPVVFVLKALASALHFYPEFNSSLSGANIVLKKYCHIGVAVDTAEGLVVPVVRDVDQKSIYTLASELSVLSETARAGKLKGSQMQGGCCTISSLGGIGGTHFTPIINAPEVAILGISKAQLKPIYQNGVLEPRLFLPLSLSYDHRVIDGAQAARFLSYLVNQLFDIRRLLL